MTIELRRKARQAADQLLMDASNVLSAVNDERWSDSMLLCHALGVQLRELRDRCVAAAKSIAHPARSNMLYVISAADELLDGAVTAQVVRSYFVVPGGVNAYRKAGRWYEAHSPLVPGSREVFLALGEGGQVVDASEGERYGKALADAPDDAIVCVSAAGEITWEP